MARRRPAERARSPLALLAALAAAAGAFGGGSPCSAATGPPGAYGYTWDDHRDGCPPDVPPFGPAAVTTPATTAIVGPVLLPSPWRWLDRDVDTAWISPTGYLTFRDQGPPVGSPPMLPDAAAPNDLLAAFWFPALDADVTVEAAPEAFHVRWRQLVAVAGPRTEVHLFLQPGGVWRMVWVDAAGVASPVVGYEDAAGLEGRAMAFPTGFREPGFPSVGRGNAACVEPTPALDCSTAPTLSCGQTVTLAYGGPPSADVYSCSAETLAAGERVVAVDVTEHLALAVEVSDRDARILHLDGTNRCSEFDCQGAHGPRVDVPHVAPGLAWFAVDSPSAMPGASFDVTVTCTPIGAPLPCGDRIADDTIFGTSAFNDRSCVLDDMGGRERIFRIDLPAPAPLAVELETASPDLWVQVHDAAAFALEASACTAAGRGGVSLPLAAAGGHVIVVDGPVGSEASFVLHVDCGGGSIDCTAAPPLACGETVAGDTSSSGAAANAPAYSSGTVPLGGAETAWLFSNPIRQPVRFRVTGGDPRLQVAVLPGCDPTDCFAVATDASFLALPAGDHVIVVDGPRGSEGPFQLAVECGALSPGAGLAVLRVDATETAADCAGLEVSGRVHVDVANASSSPTPVDVRLVVFDDVDGDRRFGAADAVVAETVLPAGFAAASRATLTLPVGGPVTFRGAALHAMIDADDAVAEADETDNVRSSTSDCAIERDPGLVDPVLQWEWTSSTVMPTFTSVGATPVVGDLDGDGIPEVIVATKTEVINDPEAVLRALSGADGREVWTADDPAARVHAWSQPALGDLDGDGRPEVVTRSHVDRRRLVAVSPSGSLLWTSAPVVAWVENVQGHGGPSIADVDGDGSPEIAWGAEVLRADGSLYWAPEPGGTTGSGPLIDFAQSCVADVLGDARQEVIAGPTVYTDDGSGTGVIVWTRPDLEDWHAAIADLDQDGSPEIVVLDGYDDGALLALEAATGATRWRSPLPRGGPPCSSADRVRALTAPSVADFDGDGLPEIAVVTKDRVLLFDGDGRLRWRADVPGCSSTGGAAGFDLDGDGRTELLHRASERGMVGSVRILDGATGEAVASLPGAVDGNMEPNPVVADVDGDGAAEILTTHHAPDPRPGVRVYRDASGSWVRARPIWSGQSYHVTNVRDDGVVPATEPKSWLVHGTYRTQLGDLSPSAPNLTISVVERRVRVLPDCSRVLDATARVGNAGGLPNVEPFSAWLFDGDPAAGGTLLASAVIDVLGPGEWQDLPVTVPLAGPGALTLHALVDDDLAGAGTVRECREDDNACTALVENPPDGGDVRPADVGPSLRVRDAGDPTLPTITATLDWSLDPRLPRTGEHYHVMRGVAPDRLGFLAGLEPYLPTSILDATPARPPGPQPLVHHYRVLAADACEQVSRE